MTLLLELSPDVERALETAAQARGQELPDYALELLEQAAQAQQPNGAQQDDAAAVAARLAALDAIPKFDTRAGLEPLRDESTPGVSRADFYGYTERDDAQV